jgi:hypothetical integral membrane protein (TIGR02206 family)
VPLLSYPHLAALAATLAVAVALVWAARRHPGRPAVAMAWALALLIAVAWAGELVVDGVEGTWSARYDLPLQLTDWVSLASVLALVTRRTWLVELTVPWGLTATLQAVLTPDLGHDFPSPYYFTFFGDHSGAVVAACLLAFGLRLYPRRGAVARVYATNAVVMLAAGIADLVTGGNYMFLRSKPAHGSLLDALGPWPWYIPAVSALALALLWAVDAVVATAARHDGTRVAGG